MKLFHRISSIFLCFAFLIFLSQVVFAQNAATQNSDIYSKFRDSRCKESLNKCDCPAAKEMKAYIDALLEMGAAKDDIFYKVAKKFSPKLILDKQVKAEVEQRLIKEQGGKYSQLMSDPASLDFGTASKKQSMAGKIFKLYNKGNADLVITNIRASCGCTTVSLKTGKNKSPYFGTAGANPGWQAVIEPGKLGELEVVLDLNHSSMGIGKQIRNVFVSNNDPLNREATLTVEIEVIE